MLSRRSIRYALGEGEQADPKRTVRVDGRVRVGPRLRVQGIVEDTDGEGVDGAAIDAHHVPHDGRACFELIPRRCAAATWDLRVHGAARRVALVEGAAVVVVDVERSSGRALPDGIAAFFAVADVVIGATDAGCHRCVLDAVRGIAGIDGAGIEVIDLRHSRRRTLAGSVAGFGTVAGICIGASSAGGKRCVAHASNRIAGVGGARIGVVNDERSSGSARAGSVADLGAIAEVCIRAARVGGYRRVADASHGIAGVRGAGIGVVRREGRSRAACPDAVTGFGAVADCSVDAARSGRDGNVLDALCWNAAVGGARVAVVGLER